VSQAPDPGTIAFIDGIAQPIEKGDTILRFVDRHRGRGHVPTLCDAPQLEPYGACRVCSVEVALKAGGPSRVVAACHTPLSPGMHILTESEKIQKLRRNILELVSSDHPPDCLTCEVNGNCELQTVAAKVGIRKIRYTGGKNHSDRKKELSHPYMTSELSKCINCSRCVRACDEIQGQFVLSMHGRGFAARIIKGLDTSFENSPCVSCGACSQACPTSAISDIFASKSIEATQEDSHGLYVLRSRLQLGSVHQGRQSLVDQGTRWRGSEQCAHLSQGTLRLPVRTIIRIASASR